MAGPCSRLSQSSCKEFQKCRAVSKCCLSYMGNRRGLSRAILTICPFCLVLLFVGKECVFSNGSNGICPHTPCGSSNVSIMMWYPKRLKQRRPRKNHLLCLWLILMAQLGNLCPSFISTVTFDWHVAKGVGRYLFSLALLCLLLGILWCYNKLLILL